MACPEGAELAKKIRHRVEELKKICQGLDETTGSQAPAGRWTPKQILSHVSGPEGIGFMPATRMFLDQDTPRLDIEAENPYFSEKRARMTVAQLLKGVEEEYEKMARFAEGITPEQLQRKAHVPLFKETPIGEYPTLAVWINAIGEYHMGFHIDHLREILLALRAASVAKP